MASQIESLIITTFLYLHPWGFTEAKVAQGVMRLYPSPDTSGINIATPTTSLSSSLDHHHLARGYLTPVCVLAHTFMSLPIVFTL